VAAVTAEDKEVTKPALTAFKKVFKDDIAGDKEVFEEIAEEKEVIWMI